MKAKIYCDMNEIPHPRGESDLRKTLWDPSFKFQIREVPSAHIGALMIRVKDVSHLYIRDENNRMKWFTKLPHYPEVSSEIQYGVDIIHGDTYLVTLVFTEDNFFTIVPLMRWVNLDLDDAFVKNRLDELGQRIYDGYRYHIKRNSFLEL